MKIKTFFKKVAQYVYPKGITCNGCGKELQRQNELSLCDNCHGELINVEKVSRTYDKIEVFSYYEYRALAKKMVLSYKDGNLPYLSEYMAIDMAKLYNENINCCDVFCYVPSHKSTLQKRGYDAMANVAKFFSEKVSLNLLQEIQRIKHNKDQTKLNISQRMQFVQDNFCVKENSYNGKIVLILDDLVTSGATINECAKQLIVCGKAKKVVAVSFARAV